MWNSIGIRCGTAELVESENVIARGHYQLAIERDESSSLRVRGTVIVHGEVSKSILARPLNLRVDQEAVLTIEVLACTLGGRVEFVSADATGIERLLPGTLPTA